MNPLLWLLPAAPMLAGVALAACGRRADAVASRIALATLGVTGGLVMWAVATRPVVEATWLGRLTAGLAVDGLSAVMLVLIAAIAAAVFVFAAAELEADEARARFFGLLLVFVGAMLATVTATSLGTLLMAWEVMGATSWALIGFWWQDPARPPAANTAFCVTRAGDLGLYLAAAAAVAGTGSLRIDALAGAESPWVHVIAAGLILAAAGKSAQLPFSSWLSAAMQGPTPVSALLHSATMVAAGAYLLLRTQPVLAAAGWAPGVVAWIGVATALLLGLVAVAQRDLKQLLAASTCAQMGFIFVGIGAGSVSAGSAHLVAHGAFKSLLFLGAGAFMAHYGTKDLAKLRGAARRLPQVGVPFTIGALALAGVAPLSGWVTKDEILAAALEAGPLLYIVGVIAGGVSALYAGKAIALLWQTPEPTDARDQQTTAAPGVTLPLAGLALGVIVLGVLGLAGVRSGFEELIGATAGTAPKVWELALSGVIALAGVALTWRMVAASRLQAASPAPPILAGWLGLDRAGAVLVVTPTLALAQRLATFDDTVVDAGVRGAARLGRGVAGLAALGDRRIVDGAVQQLAAATNRGALASRDADDRGIDRVVEAIAAGSGKLGRLARRPQTGLLHHYYAQALVGLVVLAAVVLLVR